MKKIISISIIISSIIAFSSCENHLDLKPVSYITSGSFWTSKDDVDGALNGLYVKLRNEAANNLFIWGEARSEMMERSLSGSLGYERYYEHTLSSIYPGPSWDNLYALINSCNLILKYAPTVEYNTETKKNDALAQAYTMRAYAYFTLARIWGGVPLRTEPLEAYDPMTIQLPRTAKEDVFTFIKEDLNKALELFSSNSLPNGRNKWSKPSANALKADVYLWTGKVEKGGNNDIQIALDAINNIQKSDVVLLSNFKDIFNYSNKGNKEIIMAVRFFLNESGEQTFSHNMYMSSAADIPAYVPQWQRDIVGIPKPGNGNVWRITKLVRDQFSNDDSRKSATYIDLEGTGQNQYFTNYGLKFNGIVELGTRYFLDDWIIYRYADILLMKAEAKNALGQDPSLEINEIRKRAYGENYPNHMYSNSSRDINDDAILKERLLELALEGKRWWDLVRFDKAFSLVPRLKGREDERYLHLWPLSSDALSKEVLLEQTPGYK